MPDQFAIVGMGQNCLALETPDFPGSVVKVPMNRRLIAGGLRELRRELRTSYVRAKARGAKYPMVFSVRSTVFGLDARYARERHLIVLNLLRSASTLSNAKRMFAKSYQVDVDIKHVSHTSYSYNGPALVQEKLHPIGLDDLDQHTLDRFLQNNIADLHHELWSHGMGLAASRETWCPINWGTSDDGQIRLFDFSSLTNDRTKVQRAVADDARNAVVSDLLRHCPDIDLKDLKNRLGPELNDRMLVRVWSSRSNTGDPVAVRA